MGKINTSGSSTLGFLIPSPDPLPGFFQMEICQVNCNDTVKSWWENYVLFQSLPKPTISQCVKLASLTKAPPESSPKATQILSLLSSGGKELKKSHKDRL